MEMCRHLSCRCLSLQFHLMEFVSTSTSSRRNLVDFKAESCFLSTNSFPVSASSPLLFSSSFSLAGGMYSPQMANMAPPGQHGHFPMHQPSHSGPPVRPGQVPPHMQQKGGPAPMYYQPQPGPSESIDLAAKRLDSRLLNPPSDFLIPFARLFRLLSSVPGMPYPGHFMPQGNVRPPMDGSQGPDQQQ